MDVSPTSSTTTATLDLEQHPGSVRTARRFVRDLCADVGVERDVRDAAVLLTSEVVTNAIRHGRSCARLEFRACDGRLHIEVSDGNPQPPRPVQPEDLALGGRGLAIVDSLAVDWGSRCDGRGKVVWFDLVLSA